jgi:hypothetical protein
MADSYMAPQASRRFRLPVRPSRGPHLRRPARQPLVAYLWLYRAGDLALVSSILGHGNHLANDVMYLLDAGRDRREAEHGGFLVYNRHDSGTDGLRYFKERIGFEETKWSGCRDRRARTPLDAISKEARPYPADMLTPARTGLLLFAAAYLGVNDAIHFARKT